LDYNVKFTTFCFLIVNNAQFYLDVENLTKNVRLAINIDSSMNNELKLSILKAI